LPLTTSANPPRPLVLLVDDTESILRLLQRSLDRRDFDLLTADHAGGALASVAGAARRLDLAVLDLSLPDMAAPELARELRRTHPSLRVLYTSGYLSRKEIAELADPVLRKPFGPHALTRSIRAMLQLRRRALEAADDVGPAARGASSGATLSFRLQVRPEYRAAYPGVPDGWLRAHRRTTDRGAFWLDGDAGGTATPAFPILEPHVDLATIALGAATIAVEERRSR
jgi:DNA-binding response OmpR family regulator